MNETTISRNEWCILAALGRQLRRHKYSAEFSRAVGRISPNRGSARPCDLRAKLIGAL